MWGLTIILDVSLFINPLPALGAQPFKDQRTEIYFVPQKDYEKQLTSPTLGGIVRLSVPLKRLKRCTDVHSV